MPDIAELLGLKAQRISGDLNWVSTKHLKPGDEMDCGDYKIRCLWKPEKFIDQNWAIVPDPIKVSWIIDRGKKKPRRET